MTTEIPAPIDDPARLRALELVTAYTAMVRRDAPPDAVEIYNTVARFTSLGEATLVVLRLLETIDGLNDLLARQCDLDPRDCWRRFISSHPHDEAP